MKHLLALDAGTGSGRAVIFDETGKQLAAAQREWTHVEEPGVPGSMKFDWDTNWKIILDCIHEASAQVPALNIVGVAATSMREAIVLYDEAGHEIWACANVDARAVRQVSELRRTHPGLEEEVYRKSGQTYALSAIPRLLWVKEHAPEVYERGTAVVMLSDWIAHKLGAPFTVDPSNGGTTALFNLRTRRWDPSIAESCGIKKELLSPRVFEAGEKVGEVSGEASKTTGLKAGTPIIMGGGDAQLGSVGVGAVLPNQCAVFGGSFWQQEINMALPMIDETGRVRLNFHAVPDVWQAETIAFFPGLVMRWFRDAICPDIKREAAAKQVSAYSLISKMAAEVPPGSNGIIPIFSDAMNYSKWYHAAPSFLNLKLDEKLSSRAAMARSLMENAAIVTKANLQRSTEFTGAVPSQVIFAGGASVDPFWAQILADVLQIPVATRKVKEATALGAAMCAGKGSGVYRSFDEAVTAVVREEALFEPAVRNAGVYEDLFGRWSRAYRAQLQLVDDGITDSMWRAPGE
jgi:autoinducer 2 (AI-2) kinase